MKHTPEPWVGVGSNGVNSIAGPDDENVIGWPGFDDSDLSGETHRANRNRIVACVNACKGLNPEAIPELVAAAKALLLVWADGESTEEDAYHLQQDYESWNALSDALAKLEAQ